MALFFKDRQSKFPGRYKVTTEGGETYYLTLERADGATIPGTPLNAATFNAMMAELRAYSDVRNLLDNSNLANAVNQRGYTGYGGGYNYTVDRWKIAPNLSVSVASDYITLSCSSEATERNGFTQYFGVEKTPAAGTVITVAYMDAEGNLSIGSAIMPETGSVSIGSTTHIGFRVYSEAEGARVALMIPADTTIDLVWMAVYEGEYTRDNLPKYRPKDYSAELMECMRYFQIRSTGDVDPVDLRPTMRDTPTVTKLDDGRYAYSAEL